MSLLHPRESSTEATPTNLRVGYLDNFPTTFLLKEPFATKTALRLYQRRRMKIQLITFKISSNRTLTDSFYKEFNICLWAGQIPKSKIPNYGLSTQTLNSTKKGEVSGGRFITF